MVVVVEGDGLDSGGVMAYCGDGREREKREMSFAVIIPALNEEERVEVCVRALLDMAKPGGGYEILVVDNGSGDRTVEIAQGLGARTVVKTGGTVGGLRNYGASLCGGRYLAFVDADCVVPRDWLVLAEEELKAENVGAVGCRLVHKGRGWVGRAWSVIHEERTELGEVDWLPSGSMVVRGRAFEEVGGFDERLRASEDFELCKRLRSRGYKIRSQPGMTAVHLNAPGTLGELYRKELWHGSEMLSALGVGRARFSRALAYGFLFATMGIGVVLGTLVSLLFGNHWLILICACVLVGAPIALALKSCLKTRTYRELLGVALVYMTYGVARGACVLRGLSGRLKCNLRNWQGGSF